MTQRMQKRWMDCHDMTLEQASSYGRGLAEMQRDIMFHIGDLARYCEARWPDTHHQAWPEWVSPGLIARAAAVAKAYPKQEDRRHECTYTQYMQVANKPDRHERLEGIIDKGQTSDESRAALTEENNRPRWLLAVDVNYYLHRWWYSGAGVEAAMGVAQWIQRTVERLRERGLTDVVCAFEGANSFRKHLTKDWEDRYKDRPQKDPELISQLNLVRDLLDGHGFACVSQEGMEADDILASYARQFTGKTTILSSDKDLRQALNERTNMLLDVEWLEDETSGEMIPDFKWLTAREHTELTGIRPDQWTEFQAIMGDTTDGIKGAVGIGEKGAKDLILEFGSVEGAIEAAKSNDDRIKPKKREALIEFEDKLEVTRQLVTLKTDCELPQNTRI